MLKSEILQGGKLIRHYSDTPGMGVLQTDTGILYGEAIDPNPTTHTYEEAPNPDPIPELTEDEQKARAYDILMGGAE